jgi:LemA protein
MSFSTIIGLVLLFIIIIIPVLMYNLLVRKKNQVENAFAGIDAILKKRYDLIPNLVATVKQYMVHEAGTLTEITSLRAKAASGGLSSDETVELNNRLGQALGGIMVAVENYPDLKASENFQQLQRALNEVEEQLSAARRSFNASVTDYNNSVEMFPTNIMASMMGYKMRRLFEVTEIERQRPDVADLFQR